MILRADELAGPRQRRCSAACTTPTRGSTNTSLIGSAGARLRERASAWCSTVPTGRPGRSRRSILAATGATVDVRFNEPDGININLDCGATAPEARRPDCGARRRPTSASRSTATPIAAWQSMSTAQVVDGDQLIGIIALDRLARGTCQGHRGRQRAVERRPGAGALAAAGGRLARTPVGDKYILDGMLVMERRAGWREERPRHRARVHDGRRRHRHCARAYVDHRPQRQAACPSWPRRSRSSRSSNARSTFVTRISGRQIRPSPGRSRMRAGRSRWRARACPAVGHRVCAADHGRGLTMRDELRRLPTRSRRSQSSD